MRGTSLGRREFIRTVAGSAAAIPLLGAMPLVLRGEDAAPQLPARPNIVLCMTDDQGWGDTSYNGHPVLKTPVLDAMASAGLRFDCFYAAHPVCSPTRGSVMTGRHPNRFGCFTHGKPIRPQERTIAQALKAAGYVTGHFGKWHLDGHSGAGRPIPAADPLNPGRCGFDQWVSVTNYFDLDPKMSRNGVTEQFHGDGSDIIVDEALKFISTAAADREKKPFLAVIWYGSPHLPHQAQEKDRALYAGRPLKEQNYYGELSAVDRSMGRLRSELRRLGIADNTLVWFCSDNGANFDARSTGDLRGRKATLWEGGVRVPGIIEWPGRLTRPTVTGLPASTLDIYPTIVDLLGLKAPDQPLPIDGVSLAPLLAGKMDRRPKPMPFWVYQGKKDDWVTLIDGDYKLHLSPRSGGKEALAPVMLFDLTKDARETTNLADKEPARVERMSAIARQWQDSVRDSLAGKDYPKS
ncbi:MAG: Choline-sulfatase [Phycisphaerae bacterium]|nr:Choline-sulfatase [Phycisphaerae bacterium]